MSKVSKVLLIVFIILYWVSPIDLFPGPIDDVIVTIMAVVIQKKREQAYLESREDS